MTNERQLDGRLVAADNDYQTIFWLHRFGWLTSRQLARLVWPEASQGMRMAQRTLKRLIEQKYVLERPLPTGGKAYVIGQRGAGFLKDHGVKNVSSRGNRDLRFSTPFHRALANDYAITQYQLGHKIWTEHEIQRGLSPLPEARIGRHVKIPDLLTFIDDVYMWYEVENAPKPTPRIHQILDLAADKATYNAPNPLYKNGYPIAIHSVVFVIPNEASHRAVLRAIRSRDMPREVTGYIYLDRVEMTSGLVWRGSITHYSSTEWLDYIEQNGLKL